MDLSHYLIPADVSSFQTSLISKELSLGSHFVIANASINYDVALIGVNNDVNALNNKGTAAAADIIRKHLYALKGVFTNFYIADLGNIIPTKSVKDTYSALNQVIEYLTQHRVIPIILGSSQEITFPIFEGLKHTIPSINLVDIDMSADFSDGEDFHNHSYLNNILSNPALQAFSLIAYQNYLTDEDGLEKKLNVPFEKLRLGKVRQRIGDTEIILRDADFVTIDMGAVRRADAPGCEHGTANGLYAEEICQLARFAGFSDRISTLGLFETNPSLDLHEQTSGLAAQVIWHFLDGLNSRQKDYPLRDISTYLTYVVHQPDINQDIKFYNNQTNGRWWMEIPDAEHKIIACTQSDYQQAQQNKLPERFMRWMK